MNDLNYPVRVSCWCLAQNTAFVDEGKCAVQFVGARLSLAEYASTRGEAPAEALVMTRK